MSHAIEVHDLVKRYGELVAVDHLDLQVREGEIYGLLGPNGSGKTTLINCMLALLKYDQGEILVLGEPMKANSRHLKQQIGTVSQQIAVFEELTVQENVEYFCGLYVRDRKRCRELTDRAIGFVGLEDFRKFHPRKLSGGLQRRLNIACGIAHQPKLLFLDEPTVAVDPQSRNRILEGIKELNRQGATVVYTTHYMEEVEQICDRVGILDMGRLIAEGTTDAVTSMIAVRQLIEVELADREPEADILDSLEGILSWTTDNRMLTVETGRTGPTLVEVLQALEKAGVPYGQVYCRKPNLNTVFLELTGKALRDNG